LNKGVCDWSLFTSDNIELFEEEEIKWIFSPRIYIVSAGIILLGFFQTFVFIPIIPEMLERLQD
jgi:hypothetical protein